MAGVMNRARGKLPPSGDYLDKDDLVRDQEPMALKSVDFDTTGSQFGPRWVCSVIPWYEDQDGPEGLITFTNNPTRQPMFEDLQAQIEENGNEPIGPIVLIRAKTQKGYRMYTFEDYNADGEAAQPVPVIEPPHPRPAAPVRQQTAQQAEPARKRGRPAGSKNRPKESVDSSPVVTRLPEREIAGQEQVLAVGEAECPNCGEMVRGRVLRDETGKGVIIHPHCRQTGKAEILTVASQTA